MYHIWLCSDSLGGIAVAYIGPAGVPTTLEEAQEIVTALTLHVTAVNAPIRRKFERYIEVNNDSNRPLHGANASK